jgi:Domain of unknown function (DUF932)
MKSGKSLVELAQAIERQRGLKRDFIADTRHLRMQPTDRGPALIVEERGYPLTPIAHQQLGERVGIPAKYYERMRGDAPELLARNVNHWFARQPERRLVRTLGGDARAFLSDRYQRIDNAHVAEVTLPVLAETPGIEIVSTEITEKRMYIKAVTPRIAGEVRVGDQVQAGVMITNSEVGLGAITVAPLLYRLVCLNGMVVEDNRFRKHHVGTKAHDDEAIYELLSDETRRADDNVILMKARDVVRGALDETVFRRTIQRLQDAASDRIEGNPAQAVELLSDKLNLTEAEQGGVLRYLIEGGDLSRYGMIQAVTRLAQDPDDYDRATELERAGGRILSLDRSQWQEIKRAA